MFCERASDIEARMSEFKTFSSSEAMINNIHEESFSSFIYTHNYKIMDSNSIAFGIRRLNAAFTGDFQQSLSGAETIQFLILALIYLRYFPILSFHLRFGLPKGLFAVGLRVTMLIASLTTSILGILIF